MKTGDVFTFLGYDDNSTKGSVTFHYEVVHGSVTTHFQEVLTFHPPANPLSEPQQQLITRLLDNLLLMLGISYWKLYCPERIEIKPFRISKNQAIFWNTVYTKGLGEFFYKNKIDFRNLIHFPFDENEKEQPVNVSLPAGSLVLLGGGKDSLVSAEILKKAGSQFSFFTLNIHPLQTAVSTIAQAPVVSIHRQLDPQLLKLNGTPDAYNGHIPITAVFSWTGLLAATLYGYSTVIASNEESANYGNVEYLGSQINHQWSKSLEFETLFADYIKTYVTPDLWYFSLLRPLREIKIVDMFRKHPKYFHSFSSCNKNFRITNPSESLWCGACPKCAFIYLLLSAFLPKATVVEIFHKNLFSDESLLPTFRELLGWSGIKPFECVGTPEESRAALEMISHKSEFREDLVIATLLSERSTSHASERVTPEALLVPASVHLIPKEFQALIESI